MFERFNQHIQTNFPYLNNSKLLVAISGGLDSVVLMHLLSKMKGKIGLAHVNYQLRADESNLDESFVIALSSKFKVPVFVKKAATNAFAKRHKMSIQMAAREIRYNWFEEILDTNNYDYVVTAHHLDDSIETFFINLNRSTGLEGLTGIPFINAKIVRPLLIFSKKEMESYALQNGLEWREDTSNASFKYERNKIRHQLVPVLNEINPTFKEAFVKTQNYLKGSQALVDDYIALLKLLCWEQKDDVIRISLKEIVNLPNVKSILYELLKPYGFTQWDDIFQLTTAQTGKQIVSDTHALLKDRDFLVLTQVEEIEKDLKKRQISDVFRIASQSFRIESRFVAINENYKTTSSNEVCFDKNEAKFPLFVRKWQKGDYFYPFGMQGRMKLSDFLINQKISRLEKEKIWLLCDANDKIIWIIGHRLDNRFRITDKTTEIIKITPKNEEII